ncbi:glycine/betaine/sarcosine/D-proline family reductase selenoprotein B [bacterium]|nr:glycine/betaine/sarcosine/D-proline family reductase selenoprotein B [bacterium]
MARLESLSESERKTLEALECPVFSNHSWVDGLPLRQRRVAIISTAGLHKRNDRPFSFAADDAYRIIPGDINANDLVMSHISTNFDRTGFQQDWNVIFPLDRINEFREQGLVGSVADYHYSFMGASDPVSMEPKAREVAGLLLKDKVDAVLLVPV